VERWLTVASQRHREKYCPMRSLSFLLVLLPVALVLGGTDCSSDGQCSCSALASPPIAVDLPCGTSAPTVALSGVCAGSEQVSDGQLKFGSTVPGSCHVDVTFADGSMFSTDVTFTQQWVACGSDPHGCGGYVLGELPDGSALSQMTRGPACVGPGTADGAPSEASASDDGQADTSTGEGGGTLEVDGGADGDAGATAIGDADAADANVEADASAEAGPSDASPSNATPDANGVHDGAPGDASSLATCDPSCRLLDASADGGEVCEALPPACVAAAACCTPVGNVMADLGFVCRETTSECVASACESLGAEMNAIVGAGACTLP
jgi:hypothetical protein